MELVTCPAPGQLMLEITRGTGQRCKEFGSQSGSSMCRVVRQVLPLILIWRLHHLPVLPAKLCLLSSSLFIFQLKKLTAPWDCLWELVAILWLSRLLHLLDTSGIWGGLQVVKGLGYPQRLAPH